MAVRLGTGSTYGEVINTSPGMRTYSLNVRARKYNLAALLSQDTVNITRWYVIKKENLNPNGLLHVTLNHSDATLRALAEPLRDMDNHEVNLDSASYFSGFNWCRRTLQRSHVNVRRRPLGKALAMPGVHGAAGLCVRDHPASLSDPGERCVCAGSAHDRIAAQNDLTLASGHDNLTGFPFTFATAIPFRSGARRW